MSNATQDQRDTRSDRPERVGGWVETASGKEVYPLDPRPDEIDINDIAHALSQINRYNGHTRYPYSVAQHCVLCAEYADRLGHDEITQLGALLHDAAEAYICDIPRPLKASLTGYAEIERRLQFAILDALGVPACRDLPTAKAEHLAIKAIDDAVLNIEGPVLMPVARWAVPVANMGVVIEEWTPKEAERLFLERYNRLMAAAAAARQDRKRQRHAATRRASRAKEYDGHIDINGCEHDGGIGWNPQGVWCGECGWVSGTGGVKCAAIDITKEQDDERRRKEREGREE